MDTQRVFIIWSNPIFRDAIRALVDHPDLEIIGAGSNLDDILKEINVTKPEIIIVEQTEDETQPGFDILKIVNACPWEARIIRLSLQDNELWLYHHQRQNVNTAEEFLRILQDD